MFPTPEITFITLFTQAVLYGVYVATLIHCLRWLIYTDEGWKLRDRINGFMLITTILIFSLSTTNLFVQLPLQFYAMKDSNTWIKGGEAIYGLTLTAPILIVDAVLIYRCWAVYGHSWRIVCLPIIFWLGSFAFAVLIICESHLLALEKKEDSTTIKRHFVKYIDDVIGLATTIIATNLFSTCAIIYRILSVANASGNRPRRLHNIARIIAESGILYTSTAVFTLIGSILAIKPDSGRELFSGISGMISNSMAGITFDIILIRVCQDRLRLTDSYADTGDTNSNGTLSVLRFSTPCSTTNRTTPETQVTRQPEENEVLHRAERNGHTRGN